MADFSFGNPIGLLALLSLIPFIIIYLIKPRPKTAEVPSLMFFLKEDKDDNSLSFFKYLAKDWLFLIQLLVLILLSLSIARPVLTVSRDVASENVVIVIDVSASSQVKENGKTRLDISIEKAKELVGGNNHIILAKSNPEILLSNSKAEETMEALDKIKATETGSNIGNAMLLAGEILKDKLGIVIVLSDFNFNEGLDPSIAANVLKSKNINVGLINVGSSDKNNFGIVDLSIDNEFTAVFIKNFNPQDEEIALEIGGSRNKLNIAGNSIESFKFKTLDGLNTIKLDVDDDFEADNSAYVYNPKKNKLNVLLASRNASVFLESALKSMDFVNVNKIEPPIWPRDDYDVYIIQGIDVSDFIFGTINDIKDIVSKGKGLLIYADEKRRVQEYYDIIPININDVLNGDDIVKADQINRLTQGIDFGSVNKYFDVDNRGISIASANNESVVVLSRYGKGNILFYGIFDDSSDFKFSPDYPIFISEAISFLGGRQDIKEVNLKTGNSLLLDSKQDVKTPSGTINTNVINLEKAGIYEFGDKTIVANLLNERESDINAKDIGNKFSDYNYEKIEQDVPINLEFILISIAAALILLELLYLKMVGRL